MVLAEERYLAQRQPAALVQALAGRGTPVVVATAESLALDLAEARWLERARVVLARGRSAAVLTALRVAECFDVHTVNSSAAVEAVRDKAATAARLAAAGVATPLSWVGPPAALARIVPQGSYPLVLKPVFGDNGQGLRLVATPRQLSTLPWPAPVALAQSFVRGDGDDVKVYAVGDRLWAVRAPSPLGPAGGGGGERRRVALTVELTEVAHACGALFGLELFGVDCLMTADGPVVVEVNDFPNYAGVPEADAALADHVTAAPRRRR